MNLLRTSAIAVSAGTLLLAAAPAFAAQDSTRDPHGDAAPAADITGVTVKNSTKTLSVHVKLMKAKAGRSHVVATLVPATEGGSTYVVRTVQVGHGKKVTATLESTAPDASESTLVECKGIKAAVSSGRRGQVILRVPQTCFGDDSGAFSVEVVTENQAGNVADELADPLEVEQG